MTALAIAEEKITHLESEYQSLEKEKQSLEKEKQSLVEENRVLRRYIDALKLAQVRVIKTEDPNQAHLNFEYTETLQVTEETEGGEAEGGEPKPKSKRKKRILKGAERFDNLPVGQTTVHIPQEVKDKPEHFDEVSRTETFEVVVKPATLEKHLHVYPKFRNKIEKDLPLIKAKAPSRFSASFVSASLAIDIVLSKYGEHSTLYRTEQRFASMGASISRQTLSDTVERFAEWFEPVYQKLDKTVVQSSYLQIDETFISYIFGQGKGKSTGYYWGIHKPGGETVLKWIPNRKHHNVEELLPEFSGLLQSDGYAAYQNYAQKQQGVTLLACWAHTLRKFRDAGDEEPEHSSWAQAQIGRLYALEQRWNRFTHLKDATRQQLRKKYSLPIAEQLKAKFDQLSADLSVRGERFNKAIKYANNRWQQLLECLRHGHTRLDTNEIENRFRPTAIGKKNWLFVGHPQAGQKGAIIYTLLINCKSNRIRPLDYFEDALPKLVAAERFPSAELVESLLPSNWAKANPDKIIKEPKSNKK